MATGANHSCVLLTDGSLRCFGLNANGQLDDGSNTDRSVPTAVVGLSTGAASVKAGWDHTCALMTDGTAKCWGRNDHGQLGNGSLVDSSVPVKVSGLQGLASLAVGNGFSCAQPPVITSFAGDAITLASLVMGAQLILQCT